MIFHTARELVAPTTEETAPTSPADRDFVGNERAIMKYEMSIGDATLSIKPVPSVFIRTPKLPGIHSYSAAQFLDVAARGGRFLIVGGFPDDPEVEIPSNEVKKFADWIRRQITPLQGRFQTVFIANDPSVPF